MCITKPSLVENSQVFSIPMMLQVVAVGVLKPVGPRTVAGNYHIRAFTLRPKFTFISRGVSYLIHHEVPTLNNL